jgi:ABC-type transporter Mla subunit MlaD
MSSRSKDAATLAQLATIVAGVECRLTTVGRIFQALNDAIDSHEHRITELEQANDDLDRRILALESQKPAISRPVVPNVVDSDYDDDYGYGAYIRG